MVGDNNYSFDLFDRHATCAHYWQMKVHAGLMHRNRLQTRSESFSTTALEEDLEQLNDTRWTTRPQQNENEKSLGDELLARTENESMAAALAFDNLPVHVSLLSKS